MTEAPFPFLFLFGDRLIKNAPTQESGWMLGVSHSVLVIWEGFRICEQLTNVRDFPQF